jgi:oligopeptide/dipeptide ABC transporter ATP-binding protein
MASLLSIRHLKTYFYLRRGTVHAVDDISLDVENGEATGIVGESGSGKSVTAQSILRIIFPPGKIIEGQIWFNGQNLLVAPEEEMQRIRGKKISMIFQNPKTCLNPVMTVGEQITRIYLLHQCEERKKAEVRAQEMLRLVQIADPRRIFSCYPHELSGGMCQRIMIVMALICEPLLIIADEPTTGVDVTVQRQILALMNQLWEKTGVSRIMISHDMGIIAHTCEKVVVMYAGKVMESGPVKEVFKNPFHPYTRGLIHSIPRIDIEERPLAIEGELPNAMAPPPGCRFHLRCSEVENICKNEEPALRAIDGGRQVACLFFQDKGNLS